VVPAVIVAGKGGVSSNVVLVSVVVVLVAAEDAEKGVMH
jgi:hypothetical protein